MKATNPVESLAKAVYSALENPDYLPNIEYEAWQPIADKEKGMKPEIKFRRPSTYDVNVHHFPQLWSSTALGFGGMGGQAFTQAYTTVVICKDKCAVFFDGGYAYTVDISKELWDDINSQSMKAVKDKSKYEI